MRDTLMKRPKVLGQPGKSRPRISCLATALACLIAPVAVFGEGTETVESIVRKLEANQVFDTSTLDARLSVTNRFGVTESVFRAWARKGGDTLIEITAGPDRGQKVLRQGPNVYLYFPEAEDVVWLKGSALKDSMMGSDFSYEDLTKDGSILGRFDATLEGNEVFDGAECYRVRLVAKTRNETYAREDLLVDARRFVTRKAILYSASGKPIRELVAADVRTVSGKNVPFTTKMRDLLKKDSVTEMTIERIEIGIPLPDSYFNREELSW
jgi:hypothetical protein